MYRWKLIMVEVVCVVGLAATVLNSDLKLTFCSRTNQQLRCVFRNTNEDVDLAALWPGEREIRVEAATALHGSLPCGTTLEIWSSNVTLQGPSTGHAHNKSSEFHQGKAFDGPEAGRGDPPSRSSNLPPSSSDPLTRSSGPPTRSSGPPTRSSGPPTRSSNLSPSSSDPLTRSSGPTIRSSGPTIRSSGPTIRSSNLSPSSSDPPTRSSGPLTRSSGPPTYSGGPATRRSGPPTYSGGPATRSSGPPTHISGHLPRSGSQGTAPHSSTSTKRVSSSLSKESVTYSTLEAWCSRNVTITQSKLQSLRGEFDETSIYICDVDELDGQFGKLSVRQSDVSKFSASGRQAYIEDTTMRVVSRLAMNQLQLSRVKIGRLVSPGLVQQTTGNAVVNTLSEVAVDLIETGAMLVVNGQLAVSNMTVNQMHSAAITVGSGGVLTLTNVHVHRGPQTILVLHGDAKVVINNFTLGNDTIIHLDLWSRSSQKTLYPLHIMRSAENAISSKIGGSTETLKQVEKTSIKNLVGFSWYWVVIMTVAGVFAGIIIGTAIMWRKPGMSKCQPSVLTLSDLIARDRQEEESHAPDTPERPEFNRQDSGLTTSSFTSFTPCQERPRLSSLSMRQQQDPDICRSTSTEPNVYVHVAALACTREDVIYEEVENLGVPKVDPTYLHMN